MSNSQKVEIVEGKENRTQSPLCRQCHAKVNVNVKEDTTGFEKALQKYYPKAILINDFVFKTKQALLSEGFYPQVNTMACVGLCRDEITSPFKVAIETIYGSAFSCGALGGLLLCGKTGFSAAHHHVPEKKACLVYFCFTHTAINEKGEIGQVLRNKTGMTQESTACGALMAFTNELKKGIKEPIQIDENDVEMTMLKKRLMASSSKVTPTLFDVTNAAYKIITNDLEHHSLEDSKHHPTRQYALFSGVQIHGPDGHDYVWLGKSSLIRDGKTQSFAL
ncbi:unnamed protein product [Didymodactylos carnosus]|uniref:Limiting CO2-inducible protein B/C beta carbonyic anhydrase domain-containing protein n=1 Tax=Didymodactylos carnosus TaxID=1234261 RepID=A0A814UPF8_9BILA|nr:unnamed protein product [Didymodactylos carnosus]CAF1252810.1 unnamed protein product [Didymodactylos carnosus]CAF3942711.1 unnamed protein product [Didymodactylos carnosus]CAF4059947.1 unnamed protein product [Didymodactylos carnosus]